MNEQVDIAALRALSRLLSKANTTSDAGFDRLCTQAADELERLRAPPTKAIAAFEAFYDAATMEWLNLLAAVGGRNDRQKHARVILAGLERLRAQLAYADKLYKEQNDRQEAEIERLRAPPTEEEVKRAADAMREECYDYLSTPGGLKMARVALTAGRRT